MQTSEGWAPSQGQEGQSVPGPSPSFVLAARWGPVGPVLVEAPPHPCLRFPGTFSLVSGREGLCPTFPLFQGHGPFGLQPTPMTWC